MQIHSDDRNVSQLLRGGYYRVPRFQRPYSWGLAEAEEFWQDTLVESAGSYFIGSFVMFPSGESRFDIVDGQQRLTTITLLLAAIRNALRKYGHENLARGIQELIERADVDYNKQFVLQTDSSYPYLQAKIQAFDKVPVTVEEGDEELTLKSVFSFFERKLAELCRSVETDPQIASDKKSDAVRDRLIENRDRIMALRLILIDVKEEDDAYVIFETLNTRGKDLGVADLVKNLILKEVRAQNKTLDTAFDRWNKMMATLDESDENMSVNAFISHSWLSRYSYVGKPKLFTTIKTTLSPRAREEYLDTLVREAVLYRQIVEPSFRKWSKQEFELKQSIEALNNFGVKQALPLVLSVLRALEDETLSLAQAKRCLRALEHHHYVFTAVVQKSPSGGQSKMYALHARLLLNAKSAKAASDSITDLIGKLQNSQPSAGEFSANFVEMRFSSANTHQKRLVRYTLGKIYRHHAKDDVPDMDRMTVEHISPELSARDKKISVNAMESIGNLMFVPESVNSRLGAKSWEKKKAALGRLKHVWVDPDVLAAAQWTEVEIKLRADRLADVAYREIWKL